MTHTSSTVHLRPDATFLRYAPPGNKANHVALTIRPNRYDLGSDVTLVMPLHFGLDKAADFWQALADEAHGLAVHCDKLAAAQAETDGAA